MVGIISQNPFRMKTENTKCCKNKIESNVCDCVCFSGVGLLNIYTHTLTFTFNEWTFRISRSRHRQHLSVARYDLSQMLFLFRRPGTFLLVVELEIEWKTKTSAHENCKQNSHRSQSMVDAYMLPLILSLSFCVSQLGSAAMTCLYCTIWYVSTWTSLSHRQTLTCSVFVLCLLFIFVLFLFSGAWMSSLKI